MRSPRPRRRCCVDPRPIVSPAARPSSSPSATASAAPTESLARQFGRHPGPKDPSPRSLFGSTGDVVADVAAAEDCQVTQSLPEVGERQVVKLLAASALCPRTAKIAARPWPGHAHDQMAGGVTPFSAAACVRRIESPVLGRDFVPRRRPQTPRQRSARPDIQTSSTATSTGIPVAKTSTTWRTATSRRARSASGGTPSGPDSWSSMTMPCGPVLVRETLCRSDPTSGVRRQIRRS